MGLIDFDELLYQPTHTVFGEEAVLTPASSVGALTLSAIDKTDGILVPNDDNAYAGQRGNIEVNTIVPAAAIRMTELLAGGLGLSDLDGARLLLNGKAWRVESHLPLPTPKGETNGQVMLFLIEDHS